MNRRTITKFLAVAAFGLIGCAQNTASVAQPTQAENRPSPKRPNFLFVITDDQRWDAFGAVQREQGDKGRFPWFTTPNMDRLASQGVRFRNAFVVNSLCAPSRACFLTGQYSHVNGVTNNHTPFPLDSVTHATELRKAGYTTAYFGKWHHGAQQDRPGFDTYASFIGQGRFIDCPMNINGTITPTKGWVDDVTTDNAIAFLKSRKLGDKPFDMVVGFKSPHGPRTAPGRAAKRFDGMSARPVPNLAVRPPYRPGGAAAPSGTEAQTPKATEAFLSYFRCISAIDDCLGRLLDTLDELNLADDTVVVFASDNGFYLGEHGLSDKRSAYDESLRIPLIIRYPRGNVPQGKTIDEIVTNVDLAPTFLDYAGVEIPQSMQGQSWKPLLAGKSSNWRKSFFYAYFFERNFNTPTVTAVRTESQKLIVYPGHDAWTEAFDLVSDPYEMKNLAGDASVRTKLQAEYDRDYKAVKFRIPDYADAPPPEGVPSNPTGRIPATD